MARKAAHINIEYDSEELSFDETAGLGTKAPALGLNAEFELVDSLEDDAETFADERKSQPLVAG